MDTTENPNPWTGPKIEQLTGLWRDGLSASQIASKMDGVTRNAVLGKIHRLGLAARQTKVRADRKRSYSYNPKPRKPRVRSFNSEFPAIPLSEPAMDIPPLMKNDGSTFSLIDLEANQCRWPYGLSNYHFCGRDRLETGAYCSHHFHASRLKSARPQENTYVAEPITRFQMLQRTG